MTDADVIVVGAGPTGLLLARELCLAGVRPLVVERRPAPSDVPKAGGLSGQILDLLHCRGLLQRVEEASGVPRPTGVGFPFGGMHVDFSVLDDPPFEAVVLPQTQMEALFAELAVEAGAEIRRGHMVTGVRQDDDSVTLEVETADGSRDLTASWVVGCDGASSRVRALAGFGFPGLTYPEVQRLSAFTVPEGVTVHDNGDLEVPGHGRIPFGFTPTERGVFAVGSSSPGTLGVFTSEEEDREYDDAEPMTVDEVRASVRRVLGVDLPLDKAEVRRLTRFTFHARQADSYRRSRVLLAGDAAHLFPAPGCALTAALLDAVNLAWKLAGEVHGWAPSALLDSYGTERRIAADRTMMHAQAQVTLRRGHDAAADALRALFLELVQDEQPLRRLGNLMAAKDIRYPMPGDDVHPLAGSFVPDLALVSDDGPGRVAGLLRDARPVLLDLADRPELRGVAGEWGDRVAVVRATTEKPPAEAILIRPDAHVAWAADTGGDPAANVDALRASLTHWFGEPA